jgi:hypothetical protein
MAETFTALTGSVLIGGTAHANVKAIRTTMPDIQGVEEVRVFGNNVYMKRTRPEGVCEATIDFVAESDAILFELGSPTPNDPQGPISPIDYQWLNEVTGSHFRIRFASAYPNNIEMTQDRDGHLEGTLTFQNAKKDTQIEFGSPLSA